MYDTTDPSPGDFWGLPTGIKQQTLPSQVFVAASGVLMWIKCCWASPKGPHCSQAVSSRVNPSVAQVKTKQYNQGEVFKISLQSMVWQSNAVLIPLRYSVWYSMVYEKQHDTGQTQRKYIWNILQGKKKSEKKKIYTIHEIQQLK